MDAIDIHIIKPNIIFKVCPIVFIGINKYNIQVL